MQTPTVTTTTAELPLAAYIEAAMPYVMLYAKMEQAAGIAPGTFIHSDVWGSIRGFCPRPCDENSPRGQATAFADMALEFEWTDKPMDDLVEMFEPLCAEVE